MNIPEEIFTDPDRMAEYITLNHPLKENCFAHTYHEDSLSICVKYRPLCVSSAEVGYITDLLMEDNPYDQNGIFIFRVAYGKDFITHFSLAMKYLAGFYEYHSPMVEPGVAVYHNFYPLELILNYDRINVIMDELSRDFACGSEGMTIALHVNDTRFYTAIMFNVCSEPDIIEYIERQNYTLSLKVTVHSFTLYNIRGDANVIKKLKLLNMIGDNGNIKDFKIVSVGIPATSIIERL